METKDRTPPKIEGKLDAVYWFYLCYIRSWIRIPFILLMAFFIFYVSGNLLTLFQLRHYYNSTRQKYTGGVLYDVFFDIITPYSHGSNHAVIAQGFIDASPVVSIIILFIALLIHRDVKLMARVATVEVVDLVTTAVVQISTIYPDSVYESTCYDPSYLTFGSWIFTRISPVFCGNLIWSGHCYHTLLGLIVFRWLLNDWIQGLRQTTRVILFCYDLMSVTWMSMLLFCMWKVHFHYTVDLELAILICFLLLTNDRLLLFGESWLYVEPPLNCPHQHHYHKLQQSQDSVRFTKPME